MGGVSRPEERQTETGWREGHRISEVAGIPATDPQGDSLGGKGPALHDRRRGDGAMNIGEGAGRMRAARRPAPFTLLNAQIAFLELNLVSLNLPDKRALRGRVPKCGGSAAGVCTTPSLHGGYG
jgi:hypothetical protein